MHQTTIATVSPAKLSGSTIPATYGARVFEQLQPLFEHSCCAHYRSDFLEHDRRSLELSAVPGMAYLWFVRSHGTHLVPIGIKNNGPIVKAILQQGNGGKEQIYHVSVSATGGTAKPVDVDEALSLAATRPMLAMSGRRDPFGSTPTLYVFSRGSSQIASATVGARYDRERNATLVNVAASIPDHLDRLVRMHVMLLIEDAATAEAGSLFWSFGQRTVNEMPFVHWHEALTRCAP